MGEHGRNAAEREWNGQYENLKHHHRHLNLVTHCMVFYHARTRSCILANMDRHHYRVDLYRANPVAQDYGKDDG